MKPLPQLDFELKGERIAFIGPMASGKTWCAQHLVAKHGYERVSLAAKLKSIALEMFDVSGKDGNDRLILQGLGSDLRKYDEDVWLRYLLKHIAIRMHEGAYAFVIDDVRYINEANALRENGFILIRLSTPSELISGRVARLYPNRPATALLHPSETEQEGIVADYTFVNDENNSEQSLDNLLEKIRSD
jgi:predicted kinase